MKIAELRALLIRAAEKHVSRAEAEYFADETIETDVRKPPPDGKYRKGIQADIQSWEGKNHPVKRVIDLPGFTKLDFEGRGPALKLKEIHDELERKARANGIAMVSIVNSGGMHTMHLWTQGLAKRGIFALCGWNGGPDAVVPFNGTRGLLGTNPFTYGFPSDTGEVVIDMATSEIPFFRILGASKKGTTLPPNAAVDQQGEPTTDPAKALDFSMSETDPVSNIVPMGGGYKGYAINYLMEIMTSALVGAKASSQMSNGYVETEHGGFIIAIAVDQVTERKEYDATVRSMNEKIRAQTPKKGIEKVIVPGDTNLALKHDMGPDTDLPISEEDRRAFELLAA